MKKTISDEQLKQLTTVGGWAAAGAVLLWVLYTYVLVGLYLQPRQDLDKQIAAARKQAGDDAKAILTGAKDSQVWQNLYIMDGRSNDEAGDMTSVAVWDVFTRTAQNAGMALENLKQGVTRPSPGHPDFQEIKFTADARTTTGRLAGFLYAVETNNEVPARIDYLNVHAVTPGVDNLNVQLQISALVYNPKSTAFVTSATQSSTRTGAAATASTRSGTRPGLIAESQPVVDTAALEKAMAEKRKADEEKIKADLDALAKLTPEELEKKKQDDAAAATRKAADMEAEMMRKREQEVGAATSTAPAGGIR